eukprot:1029669-Prymnesium_polylepis.1
MWWCGSTTYHSTAARAQSDASCRMMTTHCEPAVTGSSRTMLRPPLSSSRLPPCLPLGSTELVAAAVPLGRAELSAALPFASSVPIRFAFAKVVAWTGVCMLTVIAWILGKRTVPHRDNQPAHIPWSVGETQARESAEEMGVRVGARSPRASALGHRPMPAPRHPLTTYLVPEAPQGA